MDNCDLLSFLGFHEILISIACCCKRTNVCFSCGVTFAEWHCPKCNLWMDLSKRPFHCDKCGICRVGGQDNFRHCEQCCMCISVAVYETHNCIKDKYKSKALSSVHSCVYCFSVDPFILIFVSMPCVFCCKAIVQCAARTCFLLDKARKTCHVDMLFM